MAIKRESWPSIRPSVPPQTCNMCGELAWHIVATKHLCERCHDEAFSGLSHDIVRYVLDGLHRIGVLPALPATKPEERIAYDRMTRQGTEIKDTIKLDTVTENIATAFADPTGGKGRYVLE